MEFKSKIGAGYSEISFEFEGNTQVWTKIFAVLQRNKATSIVRKGKNVRFSIDNMNVSQTVSEISKIVEHS